ncbi:MAG: glycosyltransferase [Lachnospiraceae bacterium]|nr:glycosyltransferase [Lachnospiraceae bacterium]
MARLSILVPVYNVEKYLKQCLESIINQTYTDIEVICINDGSNDSSPEILDSIAAADERIKVIHKANSGYGCSMNLALEKASGEYIGIVESDDYISSDMYERLMSRITSDDGIDIVKSAHYAVENEQAAKVSLFESQMCERVITSKECKKLFAIPCNIWSAVYRKDFLQENHIRFLETPGASYQDTSFYFKAMMMAQKMILTDDAYYYYRIDNAGSSVNSNNKIFFVCDEIHEIDRYMCQKEIKDTYYVGVRNAFMFRAYYWNYNRLHVALKSAFYQEFRKELLRIQETDELKPEYWTDDYWNIITNILKDTEQFFWNSVRDVEIQELNSYTVQKEIYAEYLEDYLGKQDRIIIYGAGTYGQRVYAYLCKLGLKDIIEGFVVSEGTETLRPIQLVTELKEQLLLIVAVAENKQLPMLRKAKKLGFSKILRVDDRLRKRMNDVLGS